MKLLILGATGPTGRQITAQALEQGHDVTALVRDFTRLAARSERLRTVTGSVTDSPQAVANAVRGQDAVISALGVGQTFKPRALMTRSVPVILSAMERQGVGRLIFISAVGVGHRYPLPLPLAIFTRTLLGPIYADKKVGEDAIAATKLDWTLVHPTMLTNGPMTGRYRAGERLPLRGMPKISRADVAHFVLAQLKDPTYFRKTVLISY
jgi:putative NADH-flavin reductase